MDDFGLKFPDYNHCKVFRLSGYKSNLSENHIGMPVFISDPLKTFYNTNIVFESEFSEKPKVGFCGLATQKKIPVVLEVINIQVRVILYKRRKSNVVFFIEIKIIRKT